MICRRPWAALSAAATLALALSACKSGGDRWDETRTGFVEPFSRFLHRQFPKSFLTGSLDDVLAFYSKELAASPAHRARKKELLDRFARVERVENTIEDIQLLDGTDRVRLRLSSRLRGTAPNGDRVSVDLDDELVCHRDPSNAHGFSIVEEKVVSAEATSLQVSRFSEESETRGLAFTHETGKVKDRWGRMQNYAAGAGVGVGDYDGDGFEDVYLVRGVDSKLFRNKGDGTFEDVTERAKASKPPAGEGRFGIFGDYDGDGREDIFVGILNAPDLLLHNEGDGTFKDRAKEAHLVGTEQATGAVWADFNNDGHLDLYIVSGGNLLQWDPEPIYNALNALPNALWMNNGNGTFTDRTKEAGVGHTGWALAVSTQDFDLDGDTDIFIGNDVGYSVLYRNRGDATFDDVSQELGITRRGTGMGASWGDPNNDGFPDVFVSGMASNSIWVVDLPDYPVPAPWIVALFFERTVRDIVMEMFDGNWYFQSDGAGGFKEVARATSARNSGWAWGGSFLDYDNDGDEDIYVLNGFISGPDPTDL